MLEQVLIVVLRTSSGSSGLHSGRVVNLIKGPLTNWIWQFSIFPSGFPDVYWPFPARRHESSLLGAENTKKNQHLKRC